MTSGKDSFILPLGDMQNENSNWELTLLSDLFPEEEKEYHFTAQLYPDRSIHRKHAFKGKSSNRTKRAYF